MHTEGIRHIAIIGSGLMGHGIAQEFAVAGYEVHLNGTGEAKLAHALNRIRNNLARLVRLGVVTREQAQIAPARIHPSAVLQEAVAEADVVIEAVDEDLALKQRIFQELDQACPAETILASTTSTLVPSRLASATRRPEKVLVAHYFNPPYLMPLVEVVPSPDTAPDTVATVLGLLQKVGKQPVVVHKEAPGFIANRLQAALVREAIHIVEQGIASPQEVDLAIKTSFGRRLAVAGVFEVFDLAGWDTLLAVLGYLQPDLESSPEVSLLLQEKVERGELGVRTGQGFYAWTEESAESLRERIARALVMIARWS